MKVYCRVCKQTVKAVIFLDKEFPPAYICPQCGIRIGYAGEGYPFVASILRRKRLLFTLGVLMILVGVVFWVVAEQVYAPLVKVSWRMRSLHNLLVVEGMLFSISGVIAIVLLALVVAYSTWASQARAPKKSRLEGCTDLEPKAEKERVYCKG